MSKKLPHITGKTVITALSKAGFAVVRIRGSHQDGRSSVVPVHSGDEIGPGLLGKILRDCEMTRDEFVSLL